MLADAGLVARKDFRIEWRSRTVLTQILPFALVTLLLFGMAFDANRSLLQQVAPGLVWIAVLFASVMAAQRSFAIEEQDGAHDLLSGSSLDPAGIFLGKLLLVFAQLAAVLLFVLCGIVLLFGSRIDSVGPLLISSILAVVGLSAVAVLYGALASGLRGAETAFPILVLPVAAPILLAASRVWEQALGVVAGSPWGGLPFLAVFAIVFVAIGVLAFGWIMES